METVNRQVAIKCFTANGLKMLAMVTMFLDHLGKTLLRDQEWMTYIGRIAFPIFAFLVAEGYDHTKDFKVYMRRMIIYALISEIPYDLFFGAPINLGRQNVLFTFIIALFIIRTIDIAFQKKRWMGCFFGIAGTFAGYWLAFIINSDYMGHGVLSVVCFWVFGKLRFGWILQLISTVYINWFMIAGISFTVMLGSYELWIPVQAFAVLAMIPIMLYNGRLGRGGKKFQSFAYLFYPVHLALLGLLMIIFYDALYS